MNDPINPTHDKHLPVEAIEIIEAAIEGAPSPQAAAAQSHLLGYALRANQKGQLAIDAGKAEWYAARWIKAIREAEAKAIPANETPIAPPKRYRDPTKDDLKNGPIECEYRNSKSEHWQSGLLVRILDSVHPFLCVSKAEQLSNQWRQCRIQCRIEVAE